MLSIKGNSSNSERLTMDTDESFRLRIADGTVEIEAETYFGCRHGLETLSQLISYDELTGSLQMHSTGRLEDAPAYIHRGILIDTARNYFNLDILKGI
jgi:hexosaminidase